MALRPAPSQPRRQAGLAPGQHLPRSAAGCAHQPAPATRTEPATSASWSILGVSRPFPRPFPSRFPTLLGKSFLNKINNLRNYFGPFPNSPAFWKTRGEVEHENRGR
jgi:hypothetical protein